MLETIAEVAAGVLVGTIARDFILSGYIQLRQKRQQSQKVAELDAYYQALIDAEASSESRDNAEA